MRQLLIVAIETSEPLDDDHLAVHVPRLIQDAKGSGEILTGTFTRKEVNEAVERCVAGLGDGKHNIGVFPELSRGEAITMGLRLLAEMVPTLEGIDASVRRQKV